MRGSRAVLELVAWLAGSCSHAPWHFHKGFGGFVGWGSALFRTQLPHFIRASSAASPWKEACGEPGIEMGIPRHLADTPASQELRLLVSDLRQQEAVRHRSRGVGKDVGAQLKSEGLNGLLPVFKPSGITSTDVCRVIRQVLRTAPSLAMPENPSMYPSAFYQDGNTTKTRKIKVGHGGTLDPAASGRWQHFKMLRLPLIPKPIYGSAIDPAN